MPTRLQIKFVSPTGGSRFMEELLEAVAAEVAQLGIQVSRHVGVFPEADEGAVYVVVPHEYFVLTPRPFHPTEAQLARTIALCVEHPGNATFEVGAQWAARAGAAVDINRDSCEELNRRGVRASRFVLGYSAIWDTWAQRDLPREIDITYLGTTDPRRDHLLALQAADMSQWRTSLLIPPHEQMTTSRPDFLIGADKYQHLANSRILLNLHRGASRSLEWMRILEAMANGCVVVSEWSVDFEPLVPSNHLVLTSPTSVAMAASALLRAPERLIEMRDAAYWFCRNDLSMRTSATMLVAEAEALADDQRRTRATLTALAPWRDASPTMNEPDQPDPDYPWMNDPTPAMPQPFRDAMAGFARFYFETVGIEVSATLVGDGSGEPLLDALIAGGEPNERGRTIRSLERQQVPLRVLWATEAIRSRYPVPPRARMFNAMLREVRTGMVMLVESGDEFLPGAIPRLLAAIEAKLDLSAVYPMGADLAAGCLFNSLPPEKARLERRNYLSAPLLIRLEAMAAVGGYEQDPGVAGLEDHELYLRLISRGLVVRLVPEVLVLGSRRRESEFNMSSLGPWMAEALTVRSRGSLDAGYATPNA